MNVSIQFAIAKSWHPGFPLVAEGLLNAPAGQLRIIEYGRSEKEIYERVFGFARMHSQTPTAKSAPDLDDAAQWIVNCRELCGNEAQALRDWQADNGVALTPGQRHAVTCKVQNIWNQARKAAGVKGAR